MGGTHTLGASSSLGGAGSAEFSSGTTTIDGTLTVDTVRILGGTLIVNTAAGVSTLEETAGSLGGTGTVTVSTNLTWSGGNMAAGTGKTVLGAGGAGTISGATNKWLSRTLENSGTISYTGSNLLFGFGAGQAGVLSNLAGGTVTVSSGGDFTVANVGTHGISNAGNFLRSGAGATNIGVTFDNTGSANVTSGTLSLDAGGTHTGSFSAAGGAILRSGSGVAFV
jgi:hypothetical protein